MRLLEYCSTGPVRADDVHQDARGMSIALTKSYGIVKGYQQQTEHYPQRYARSLGYLDWDNQPLPFRLFEGAQVQLWETGLVGQLLYLGAQNLRATGIGCFFDDEMHSIPGLKGAEWQSLYHFTVGRHVADTRLETKPPYFHLEG